MIDKYTLPILGFLIIGSVFIVFQIVPELSLPRGLYEWGLLLGSIGTLITAIFIYMNLKVQSKILEHTLAKTSPIFDFDLELKKYSKEDLPADIKDSLREVEWELHFEIKNIGEPVTDIEVNVLEKDIYGFPINISSLKHGARHVENILFTEDQHGKLWYKQSFTLVDSYRDITQNIQQKYYYDKTFVDFYFSHSKFDLRKIFRGMLSSRKKDSK